MKNHIHQDIKIDASPEHVYNTLLDSEKFSAMSGGAPASIDANEGGAFICFGDYLTGRNIELVKNKRVVQAWRAKSWPEGVHSIVRFELSADGDGTQISFDHTGFPEAEKEHLEKGWHDNYWNPMKGNFVA